MRTESIFQHRKSRDYLKQLLDQKSEKNPYFSLRAFAKQLGVSASSLSGVLLGKKKLSADRGLHIARRLGLSSAETEYLLLMLSHENAKSQELRDQLYLKLNAVRPRPAARELSAEVFQPLSRWYSMLLLEICTIETVTLAQAGALSRRLGVPEKDIAESLGMLVGAGLLEMGDGGVFRRPTGEVLFRMQQPSESARAYHRQISEKAMSMLEVQPIAERYFASEMIPIPKRAWPMLREVIEAFLDRMHEVGEVPGEADCVYGVSLGVFKAYERETEH